MAGKYANQTTVSVEKSRAEIETLLARYGAEQFGYMTEPGRAVIAFKVKGSHGFGLTVRMTLPLPAKGEKRFTQGWRANKWMQAPDHAVQERWEQACRSSWRSMLLVIKAKLEAVAGGISTVEREFLADVVLPSGQTFSEEVIPSRAEIRACTRCDWSGEAWRGPGTTAWLRRSRRCSSASS